MNLDKSSEMMEMKWGKKLGFCSGKVKGKENG